MSANITKLIAITVIVTIILSLLGLPLFKMLDFSSASTNQIFIWGTGIGAFLASLMTAIILLTKPYQLPIEKQTLFIGNLAFKSSERELRKLFNQCGEVFSIRLMTDKVTRKPRGYGFIEMDKSGAKRALAELNETEFMGRDLRVSPANDPAKQADD
jgi:hypothetical protein